MTAALDSALAQIQQIRAKHPLFCALAHEARARAPRWNEVKVALAVCALLDVIAAEDCACMTASNPGGARIQ